MNITKDINNIVKYEELLNRNKNYEYQNTKKIMNIFQKINLYYSNHIPSDYLIKRLSKVDFLLNKVDSLIATIILGISTSILVNLIFQFMSDFSFSKSWIDFLILSVIYSIFLVIPTVFLFMGGSLFMTIKSFTKYEYVLIWQYEKKVILKKLSNDFQLDLSI